MKKFVKEKATEEIAQAWDFVVFSHAVVCQQSAYFWFCYKEIYHMWIMNADCYYYMRPLKAIITFPSTVK